MGFLFFQTSDSNTESLSLIQLTRSPQASQPTTIQLSRLARRLKSPIPKPPHTLNSRIPRPHPSYIMSSLPHTIYRAIIKKILKRRRSGHKLIMHSRLLDRLWQSHIVFEDVPDGLDGRGDDAGAPCCADG